MKFITAVAFAFIILVGTTACGPRISGQPGAPLVLVIPLEDDIPGRAYTDTYVCMLEQLDNFRFMMKESPFKDRYMQDWTDDDYAALAQFARINGAQIITFGRVDQGRGAIGLLSSHGQGKAQAVFHDMELHCFQDGKTYPLKGDTGKSKNTILQHNLDTFWSKHSHGF